MNDYELVFKDKQHNENVMSSGIFSQYLNIQDSPHILVEADGSILFCNTKAKELSSDSGYKKNITELFPHFPRNSTGITIPQDNEVLISCTGKKYTCTSCTDKTHILLTFREQEPRQAILPRATFKDNELIEYNQEFFTLIDEASDITLTHFMHDTNSAVLSQVLPYHGKYETTKTVFPFTIEHGERDNEYVLTLETDHVTNIEQMPLESLVNILPVGICICDKNGVIKLKNNIWSSIWDGFTYGIETIRDYEKLKGKFSQTNKRVKPHEWPIAKTLSSGSDSLAEEINIVTVNKSKKTVLVSAVTIRDKQGEVTHAIEVVVDITKRKRAEEIIKHMAYFDTLTKLPNRVSFNVTLIKTIADAQTENRKFALFFLDIDRFKRINDTLGHLWGDQLLREVAQRLSECAGSIAFTARLSGDEFTVIMPSIENEEDVVRMADTISASLSAPFHLNDIELSITASMGISIFPEGGEDMQTLLMNADIAMYQVKKTGRNGFKLYNDKMNEKALDKLEMEMKIRKALQSDQLLVYYQPIISTRTKKILGLEALVRWNHPYLGIILPGEFWGIAEDLGLVNLIDRWNLRKSLIFQKKLEEMGYDNLTLAVNIAGTTFREKDFTETIKSIISETQNKGSLELEITENVLMENTFDTNEVLFELKEMNIRLAVDDFGTGYSSLSYLKYFPIDKLKIDQSFVKNININNSDTLIVKSIITLAKSLKLTVTAEGVETVEQMHFLERMRCTQLQGFIYSPPVPEDAILSLLEKEKQMFSQKRFFGRLGR